MSTQATETILAIDFSLDRLDVSLRASDGRQVWSHQAYSNNWPGFQALKAEVLASLAHQASPGLTVAGESTGLLWWHLYYQIAHDPDFAPYEPQLVLLNPAHVKHFRQALPERDKTDRHDPDLIERYYRTHGCDHPYQFQDRYLPLRALSRAYCRLIHTLAAQKAYFLAGLYLVASEYQRREPFSDPFGVTSGHVLTAYPDLTALATLPTDDLVAQLRTWSRNTLPQPAENARKLQAVARDSYPCPAELGETVHAILHLTLEQIRLLEDHQETYAQLIERTLADLPEADLALAQPGLGPILVAGCLSEIQATDRFTTGLKYDPQLKRLRPRTYRDGQAAVANLAGLWWPKRDSGRFEADDRHLARERNPYLRFWFVQAAHTLQRYDPAYAAYYQRKFKETTRHPQKRALILTARKAVRLIFALLHKGQQMCREEGLLT
jgi:transposase